MNKNAIIGIVIGGIVIVAIIIVVVVLVVLRKPEKVEVRLNGTTLQWSTDNKNWKNASVPSNVVTVNFLTNIGTAVEEYEKQIEEFFLFYKDEEE